jgi:hypothetical protein
MGRRLSTRRKLNLEPRGAATTGRSGTSDLVDFLREGPPGASTQSNGRVNRSAAAPFADDYPGSTLGSSTAASSKASMNTVNSRTGLLSSGQNGYGDYSASNSPITQTAQPSGPNRLMPSSSADDFSGGMPPRTRRRIKDPYAIDDSDDDDDLLTALPGGAPKRQEESLIDFLNSVDPPPNSGPQPLALDARANSGNPAKPLPHKISVAAGGMNPLGSHPASPRAQAPGRSKAAGSPMTPTSAGGMGAGSMGAPPRKMVGRPSARADTDYTSTSDLADFLKNSGPPEPPPNHNRNRSMNEGGEKKRWRGFRAMLDQKN